MPESTTCYLILEMPESSNGVPNSPVGLTLHATHVRPVPTLPEGWYYAKGFVPSRGWMNFLKGVKLKEISNDEG
jgi:hypothetical protein